MPGVVQGTHLLVATGRTPNVAGLNLEAAAIKYDKRGIQVNKGLVTSNSRVFAIGDVIGGPQFTHVANYHAGIVIRRALFRLPATVNSDIIPWVTFTDPELAHVGLTEDAARKRTGARARLPLALSRERSRPDRAGDRGVRQGRDRRQGQDPGRQHRRRACRRADPDVVAGRIAGARISRR